MTLNHPRIPLRTLWNSNHNQSQSLLMMKLGRNIDKNPATTEKTATVYYIKYPDNGVLDYSSEELHLHRLLLGD